MNIKYTGAIFLLLFLNGCSSPSSTQSITEDQVYTIAKEILHDRDIDYQDYGHVVMWKTNYWFVRVITPVKYDDNGRRQSMPVCAFYLDLNGHLLAILGGGQTNQEEVIEWENNLMQLEKNNQ